jgi:hypothetical protein
MRALLVLVLGTLAACAGGSLPPHTDPLANLTQRLYTFYLNNGDCELPDSEFCRAGGCEQSCAPAAQFQASILANFNWPFLSFQYISPRTCTGACLMRCTVADTHTTYHSSPWMNSC